ncbi:hypothetical protein XENOCAPTIV_003129, partial [Xenoophorus captivus]
MCSSSWLLWKAGPWPSFSPVVTEWRAQHVSSLTPDQNPPSQSAKDSNKLTLSLGILGEMKQDASSDQIFISEDSQGLLSEPPVITSDPPASTLQEASSHGLDNRDDVSDGHLSDCLQAELAVVYSDSDAGEDQWPALASCDETDHSKGNRANAADTCNAESMKENGRMEEIQTGVRKFKEGEMDEQKEKKSGVMEGSEEQMNSRRDIFLRSPSVSSTASSTDPDRRVCTTLSLYSLPAFSCSVSQGAGT